MDEKTIVKLELNKIMKSVAAYAVLPETRRALDLERPQTERKEAEYLLDLTAEADLLLYRYGVGKIEGFPDPQDCAERAQKGATLSCAELLALASLLRSARIAYRSVHSVSDDSVRLLKEIADRIYFDEALEKDITEKILSDEEVSDYASDELYSIRRSIRLLNERIRNRLSEYLSGDSAKFLQEGIVTMRDNRYVLPVRAEYKSRVRGFVHDRSASGATFFIEPEEVLEMNNELRELASAEKEEIERILSALSGRVGRMAPQLAEDMRRLSEIDRAFAKAEYSYKNKCVRPALSASGAIDIVKGRHPLLDPKTAVPVSVSLGREYRFLLISGPNTGGKTVTLKMCGLFCMMACCGVFIPASEGSEVSVFADIFTDIGDAQSIEENLSTFSSHIKNVIEITERADARSLVLIDELGGGTDPEEGQALAKAVLSKLLKLGCRGIVTTHYTALKEYAFAEEGIENASMEFDMNTLQPLYRIQIGVPGSSNAIAISRRLGLSEDILREAISNLSEGAQKFENILRTAEAGRIAAEEEKKEAERLRAEWSEKLAEVTAEREKLKKEREKLYLNAKVESRRIVNERAGQAEELLREIEKIAHQSELTEADLIRARTLKNRLADKAYGMEFEPPQERRVPAEADKLKVGDRVFVGAMQREGEILSLNARKKEAEVLCGNVRVNAKISDLSAFEGKRPPQNPDRGVKVVKNVSSGAGAAAPVRTEINLLGMTVSEAIEEVDAFLDKAVLSGLDEVKIIHGMGTGKLREGIRNHLRGHKNVAEFRSGRYGEGETGVTIVKLK